MTELRTTSAETGETIRHIGRARTRPNAQQTIQVTDGEITGVQYDIGLADAGQVVCCVRLTGVTTSGLGRSPVNQSSEPFPAPR